MKIILLPLVSFTFVSTFAAERKPSPGRKPLLASIRELSEHDEFKKRLREAQRQEVEEQIKQMEAERQKAEFSKKWADLNWKITCEEFDEPAIIPLGKLYQENLALLQDDIIEYYDQIFKKLFCRPREFGTLMQYLTPEHQEIFAKKLKADERYIVFVNYLLTKDRSAIPLFENTSLNINNIVHAALDCDFAKIACNGNEIHIFYKFILRAPELLFAHKDRLLEILPICIERKMVGEQSLLDIAKRLKPDNMHLIINLLIDRSVQYDLSEYDLSCKERLITSILNSKLPEDDMLDICMSMDSAYKKHNDIAGLILYWRHYHKATIHTKLLYNSIGDFFGIDPLMLHPMDDTICFSAAINSALRAAIKLGTDISKIRNFIELSGKIQLGIDKSILLELQNQVILDESESVKARLEALDDQFMKDFEITKGTYFATEKTKELLETLPDSEFKKQLANLNTVYYSERSFDVCRAIKELKDTLGHTPKIIDIFRARLPEVNVKKYDTHLGVWLYLHDLTASYDIVDMSIDDDTCYAVATSWRNDQSKLYAFDIKSEAVLWEAPFVNGSNKPDLKFTGYAGDKLMRMLPYVVKGDRIFAGKNNVEGSSLVVLDKKFGHVIQQITSPRPITFIGCAQDAIYIAHDDDETISIIDSETGVLKTIAIPLNVITIGPFGRIIKENIRERVVVGKMLAMLCSQSQNRIKLLDKDHGYYELETDKNVHEHGLYHSPTTTSAEADLIYTQAQIDTAPNKLICFDTEKLHETWSLDLPETLASKPKVSGAKGGRRKLFLPLFGRCGDKIRAFDISRSESTPIPLWQVSTSGLEVEQIVHAPSTRLLYLMQSSKKYWNIQGIDEETGEMKPVKANAEFQYGSSIVGLTSDNVLVLSK